MATLDVVFVVHEAQRSGAPIALLNLLRWLRQKTDMSFEVVLGEDGPLAKEFEALVPVALADAGVMGRVTSRTRLVYANSTWSHALVDQAPPFEAPVVSHVHELRANLRPVDPLRAGKRPERYVAVSKQVKSILVADYSIDPDRVTICKPFVPVCDVVLGQAERVDWQDLGLPADVRVVGAVGSLWPTKGPDLFVRLAEHVVRTRSNEDDVHFVWVGGPSSQLPVVNRRVEEAGLSERVHLLGEVQRPFGLMAAFDVLVLPSREDAFPLVVLEAGVLGRCVVAFDCGAGVREVLGDGRGALVGLEDVVSMGRRVVALLRDNERRRDMGAGLAEYVAQRHDVTTGAPAILSVIESTLQE